MSQSESVPMNLAKKDASSDGPEKPLNEVENKEEDEELMRKKAEKKRKSKLSDARWCTFAPAIVSLIAVVALGYFVLRPYLDAADFVPSKCKVIGSSISNESYACQSGKTRSSFPCSSITVKVSGEVFDEDEQQDGVDSTDEYEFEAQLKMSEKQVDHPVSFYPIHIVENNHSLPYLSCICYGNFVVERAI